MVQLTLICSIDDLDNLEKADYWNLLPFGCNINIESEAHKILFKIYLFYLFVSHVEYLQTNVQIIFRKKV